jgi:hypothetical protein
MNEAEMVANPPESGQCEMDNLGHLNSLSFRILVGSGYATQALAVNLGTEHGGQMHSLDRKSRSLGNSWETAKIGRLLADQRNK